MPAVDFNEVTGHQPTPMLSRNGRNALAREEGSVSLASHGSNNDGEQETEPGNSHR
jgi:hypothetical protein